MNGMEKSKLLSIGYNYISSSTYPYTFVQVSENNFDKFQVANRDSASWKKSEIIEIIEPLSIIRRQFIEAKWKELQWSDQYLIIHDENNQYYLINGKSETLYRGDDNQLIIFISKLKTPKATSTISQQIIYGAPGTGKSHLVKGETKFWEGKERVVRTTFHPDSDYSTFVGAYKPSTEDAKRYVNGQELTDANGEPITEKVIVYEFVPQAFLQAYTNAWKDRSERQYLIIEEINRGNCAQIFGDLFQLLDRDDSGYSEYPIRADKDLQKFLEKEFADVEIADYPKVKSGVEMLLPSNLFIRATMNTSDQSLFPIDSAFKRRWDMKYLPISKAEEKNFRINIENEEYDWWEFLNKINKHIGTTTYSEDKKLGYFFCNPNDGIIKADTFANKVIFYLWNDVFKDYGFNSEIFNDPTDTEDSKLSFNKFFKFNGEANTTTIKQFIANLGVKPIGTNSTTTENIAE